VTDKNKQAIAKRKWIEGKIPNATLFYEMKKNFPTYIRGTTILNGLCPSNGRKEERNQRENVCRGGGKHT